MGSDEASILKIKGHIPSSSDGCCVAQLSSFTSGLILDGGFLMIAATQSVPTIKHYKAWSHMVTMSLNLCYHGAVTVFEAPTFGI